MKVECFRLGGTHLNKPVFLIFRVLPMAGPLLYCGEQMIITSKLTDEELIESIYRAASAYEKLENNT